MDKVMKTPGVYVVEKSAFPSSVVEVATAVPAFVGYTEKALNGRTSLTNTPRRITSMAEYHKYFGVGPEINYELSATRPAGFEGEPAVEQDGTQHFLVRNSPEFYLY